MVFRLAVNVLCIPLRRKMTSEQFVKQVSCPVLSCLVLSSLVVVLSSLVVVFSCGCLVLSCLVAPCLCCRFLSCLVAVLSLIVLLFFFYLVLPCLILWLSSIVFVRSRFSLCVCVCAISCFCVVALSSRCPVILVPCLLLC
jgi:hypothetical protein